MKKIAIIPARSGSKGLKDKNIIDLCGKPLIAYSIEAATNSGLFSRIIVSTDSQRYGDISRKYGAEVFYRDDVLSDDNVPTFDVVQDVLRKIKDNFDYFVLLQPTSPMRTGRHIVEASESFEENLDSFDFLVSVKKAAQPSILAKPIDEDQSLKYFDMDFSNFKRQNYQEYTPNGALFFGKEDAYLKQKHFFGPKSLSYKMAKIDSIDVDDIFDYEIAEMFMSKRLNLNFHGE